MTRSRFAALAAAALVLAACGNDDAQPGAAPASDASAPAAPAPAPAAPEAAPPTGMAGAPGVARRGVDSANAAYQRQEDEVNRMSQPGGTTP
ncbi:MAG TPA: hypothetical protein VF092_05035 [Longimicrobium sp.]